MTTYNPGLAVSKEAAEDLSNDRYRFVVCDSDGKIKRPDNATTQPFGILQNAPVTGQPGSVLPIGCGGTSLIVLGATLDEGVMVTTEYVSATDAGKAKAAASGSYPVGPLLVGGAEDELGEVLLASQTVQA